MTRALEYIIFALIPAYLVGSIPFGYIVGRMNGIDIRDYGSHNIGATNVWRVLGRKWGLPTFIMDFLKVPMTCVFVAIFHRSILHQSVPSILILCGCVLGHNYPITLQFKGGKGIATSAGGLFCLQPIPFVIVAVIWGITFWVWRYVSLASIVSAAILPFAVLLINGDWLWFGFCVCLSALAIWRHRANIDRLLKGTEMGWKKKESVKP